MTVGCTGQSADQPSAATLTSTTTSTSTSTTTSTSTASTSTPGPTWPEAPDVASVAAESLGNVVEDLEPNVDDDEQSEPFDPTVKAFLTEADPRRIDQLAGGVCAAAADKTSWDELSIDLGRLHDQLTATERESLEVEAWLTAAGVLLGFFCPELVPDGDQ